MNDEDINFSLDMVSTDMNFEQAYSMYNNLQQENAIHQIENLQKIQNMSLFNHQINMEDIMKPNVENMDEEDDEEEEEDKEDSDNEFDKFFSNTESNALEKFLDNLANPTNSNPLDLYNNNYSYEFNFKPKNDFSAFSHPPQYQFQEKPEDKDEYFKSSNIIPQQLPTPESRQSSIDEEEPLYKKRKRSTSKPLLTLEQKRLNHSYSEQKRRQLCKLAYERCLRLITNFDNYCKNPPMNKKSKRKQFNKDGLPNLSKFCALSKVSNEILKIRSKNDDLKKLLNI
ncbi:hypothetical protein CLIB1444_04S04918 [[Candida] jaroonii]|uniref:Uncharacterized protein n=1 Tax=[Candida] jaroonii TaxID=467808 RepID=A0ACA9Y7L3_9ASCO|nr:hypothetical protein CLIB1444_04S04918 [[Candida] jaroonii]